MNMTADEIARTVVLCLHGACEPLCANQCGIVQVARLALAEGGRQAFDIAIVEAGKERVMFLTQTDILVEGAKMEWTRKVRAQMRSEIVVAIEERAKEDGR